MIAKLPGIVPSVFVDRRHGQRGVMIANEVCDQLGWFFVAGIGGYLVDTVGRLVEAFSSFVDGLRFAFYLKSNCSLSNVSDDHAGMAMWLVWFSGSLVGFEKGFAQMATLHLGQGIGAKDPIVF